MPVRLHHIIMVDAHDLPALARFWTQALGWTVLSERQNEIVIGTDQNAPAGVCLMPVTDPKTVKNRVHLDLTSSAADRDQETGRLLTLGARRAGIGQAGQIVSASDDVVESDGHAGSRRGTLDRIPETRCSAADGSIAGGHVTR